MRLRFGEFELDTAECRLSRDGSTLRVEPLVFDLIAALARRPGRLVTRQEILDTVWQGTHVSQWAVARVLKEARRALGDDGGRQRVIETVRGRGFRLCLPVRVESDPAEITSAPGSADPFIGRADELDALSRALQRAIAGTASSVVLLGEPGIGKTRLLDHLAARARQHGARVWRAACLAQRETATFRPWVQLLRNGLAEIELFPDPAERRVVAELMPDLAGALGVDADPPRSGELLDIETLRGRLFGPVAEALVRASAEQPLVLLVDDLQWADLASLELLEGVTAMVSARPVLIAAAAREEGAQAPPWEPVLRDARTIRLEGLPRDAVSELVRHLRGYDPSPAEVEALITRTGGNPFFLRCLLERPEATGDRALPRDIAVAAREHLDGLSGACVEQLGNAAVIGGEFDLALLATLAGCERAELLTALGPARRRGVLREVEDAIGRWRFTHDLTREALYHDLGAEERAARHTAVGQLLEARFESGGRVSAGAIARHFVAAARNGADTRPAVSWSQRAAEEAMARMAPAAARIHYEEALAALEADPTADERTRCALEIERARALERSGDPSAAIAILDTALEVARRHGRSDLFARAAWYREAAGHMLAGAALRDPTTLRVLGEALDGLGDEDGDLRVWLEAGMARRLYYAGEYAEAIGVARRARARAVQSGDPRLEYAALEGLHYALWSPEHARERRELGERMIEIGEGLDSMETEHRGRLVRMFSLVEEGDIAEAERELFELERIGESAPWLASRERWTVRTGRVFLALHRGDLEEAEQRIIALLGHDDFAARHVDAGLALGGQHNHVRILQDRFHDLLPVAKGVPERLGAGWYGLTAQVCAEAGRMEEAAEAARAAAAHDFAALDESVHRLLLAAAFAEACFLMRDPELAARIRDYLMPWKDAHVLLRPMAASYGSMRRYVGLAAHCMGDLDDAIGHLEAAERFNETIGNRPYLALGRVDLARALLARGREDERLRAGRLLEQAVEAARERGWKLVLRRAEEVERGAST